jgi:hypothetical protein
VLDNRTLNRDLEVSAPGIGQVNISHGQGLTGSQPPFMKSTVAPLKPSDRWRLFAVSALGSTVKSAQEVGLYAAQLRARRAVTHIYTHEGKIWMRSTRPREY